MNRQLEVKRDEDDVILFTPLLYSFHKKRYDVAKYILESTASYSTKLDINASDSITSKPHQAAIHYMVNCPDLDIPRLVLHADSSCFASPLDVNQRTGKYGASVLQLAVEKPNLELFQLLLDSDCSKWTEKLAVNADENFEMYQKEKDPCSDRLRNLAAESLLLTIVREAHFWSPQNMTHTTDFDYSKFVEILLACESSTFRSPLDLNATTRGKR